MKITVLTPEKEIFRGNVISTKLPGVDGKFQILNNHAPLVAALGDGSVQIITDEGDFSYWNAKENVVQVANEKGKQINFNITTGFVEVLNNEISLLVQGYTSQDN
jgi:F-type H+-transporting ATPase subunit epsilon